jgi:hypothetical protein
MIVQKTADLKPMRPALAGKVVIVRRLHKIPHSTFLLPIVGTDKSVGTTLTRMNSLLPRDIAHHHNPNLHGGRQAIPGRYH